MSWYASSTTTVDHRLETVLGAGTLLGRTLCSVVAGHAALFVLLVAIAPIDIMIFDCKTLRRTGI